MTDAILILSTLVGLATGPQGPARGPAAASPPVPLAPIEDPCEGRGRVDDVPSPYDDLPHTCVCTVVRDIHGRPLRVEVRCW